MRHGQDDETYIGGWSDVSLIESGKEEVLETALWMKQNLAIKKIDVSDVKRAIESAPLYLGSVSGKCFPISPKAAAPRSASIIA